MSSQDFHDMPGNNTTTPSGQDMFSDTNPRLVNGVIVLILIVFNLLGNGLVFWVYQWRVKDTVFSLFVRMLAGLDLFNAVTTMLMDVIIKFVPPSSTSSVNMVVLCKLTHFQVYANSLISGCVLMLIAYQRYRKICHPLKEAIQFRTAKLILVISVITNIILCTPCLVVNGPQQIQILVRDHPVTTTICRYDINYYGTPLQKAVSYTLVLAFFLVLCSTVIFYFLVSRALKNFETTRASLYESPTRLSTVPENQELPEADRNGSSVQGHQASHELPRSPRTAFQAPRPRFSKVLSRASIFSLGQGGPDRVSTHMYKMFMIITVVFIVSYLPHLVVLVLSKVMKLEERAMTTTERFFIDLAYNTPYISTVANPLVYGFRSAEFREHCKNILKWPCSRRKRFTRGRY